MIPLLIISKDFKLINDYVGHLKVDCLFFEVSPSTKEYSIDDIKNVAKETKVFYPKTRIYFFPNFQLSSIPAQNSFLKLLEEPPSNVQFILTSNNKNNLLETIVSRTKLIKLKSTKTFSLNKNVQEYLKELIVNKNLKTLNKAQFSLLKREEAFNIFDQMVAFFQKRLADDHNSAAILKEILRLKNFLENNNLNPQLTIDQTLIFIYKRYKMK